MYLDANAITGLYRRHARPMLSYFARRTHDPEVAVDLVAETFAAAISDRGSFRGNTDDEAVGWLYGIARHQLSAWYRRGEVERRAMARLGIERRGLEAYEYERIVELAGLAEHRLRVADALHRLSDPVRAAVRMRVVEERSYAAVSASLGITEPTARARVSRGLRELAGILSGDDDAQEASAGG